MATPVKLAAAEVRPYACRSLSLQSETRSSHFLRLALNLRLDASSSARVASWLSFDEIDFLIICRGNASEAASVQS